MSESEAQLLTETVHDKPCTTRIQSKVKDTPSPNPNPLAYIAAGGPSLRCWSVRQAARSVRASARDPGGQDPHAQGKLQVLGGDFVDPDRCQRGAHAAPCSACRRLWGSERNSYPAAMNKVIAAGCGGTAAQGRRSRCHLASNGDGS